jgi:carboxyl-terminal processing protease
MLTIAATLLPLLIDSAVKGTIILMVAFLLSWAWRGASAGGRHLLWTLTLIGLLAAPAVSWVAPTWHVAEAPWSKSLAARSTSDDDAPLAAGFAFATEPVAPEPPKSPAGSVLLASRGATPSLSTNAASAPSNLVEPTSHAAAWMVIIWLGGVLLSVAWLVAGWLSLARLARSCQRIHEGPLLDALAQASAELGLRRRVRLLASDTRSIPMTWGFLRPVVLLPRDAETWRVDRLRMVLVHELGHVQRCDCLTQMLAHLARGLYWYQPLAWLAVRRLRMDQEQACDDLVLQSGASGPDYAEHLVVVTTGLPANLWMAPVALGMGRSETLRRRLISLLDGGRNHGPISRRKLAFAGLVALALFLPLGTAGWAPATSAHDAPPPQDQAQKSPAGKESAPVKRIIEVQKKLADHYILPVDERSLTEHALKGLLQALKDPYTAYISDADLAKLESDIKGALTGIGAQLQMVGERLNVATPLEGSPALKAGVRPGDFIEAIDGQSTRGLTIADAVQRILGPAGSTVKLKVLHADGVLEDIAVTRGEIRLGTINGFRRGADGKWQYLLDDAHKIGYLHINQFGSRTAAEVRETIEALQKAGMKALILDLRFCPGGLLDQAVETCKLFMNDGLILTTRGPGKEERSFRASGKALGDFPLLVLLNDQTASAAEIVAGSLRDNGRALLLGTRSFGKGSVQSIMKLDEGGALKITTANHYLPSGRNIQKRPGEKTWGVDPTDGYYIPLTAAQTTALTNDVKTRARIGLKKDELPPLAPITAKLIEETHADPQLAGALRTTIARLTGGEFIKVGQDLGALADHAQRLEEMRSRREQLQQNLQQLEREIADLQQAPGKNK